LLNELGKLLRVARQCALVQCSLVTEKVVMAGSAVTIQCVSGQAAQRRVLVGFAPAHLLHSLSFADVLDEDTGRGYQRRFNSVHSLDFRKYIQRPQSTTIPLTFNLRPRDDNAWQIVELGDSRVRLEITEGTKILSQVDCQHRLGHLQDLSVELPFMFFVGLADREEMEIFNVINSKAKGLSSSLIDFHDAQLSTDLAADRPELFIAVFLKNEPSSPWFRQLDLGGKTSSGMTRRASLRTLQKAVKRFIARTKISDALPIENVAQVVLDFWAAVAITMPEEWAKPRKHMLTKGIGVYALMDVAADIYLECRDRKACDRRHFIATLADFASDFDWSTNGPMKGLGGEGGVKAAVQLIRESRKKARFKVVAHG
jgi:DNA sulfur modification protein DndB